MPQMMPINWLTLMLMFVISFNIMLSLIYFMKPINMNKINYKNNSHSSTLIFKNWLW